MSLTLENCDAKPVEPALAARQLAMVTDFAGKAVHYSHLGFVALSFIRLIF